MKEDEDLAPDWDTETAFELVMGWQDEAEKIALENAEGCRKRGFTDGETSWRNIARTAAKMWAENKNKILKSGPTRGPNWDENIAAELLKPYTLS